MISQHLSKFMLSFADALEVSETAVVRSHAVRLRDLAASSLVSRDTPRGRVPVQSISEVEVTNYVRDYPLAGALLDLMPAIHFTRSEAYLAKPPSADFANNYGYAVICGPDNGPPTLMRDSEIAFGVLLLGAGTHYPLHHHPADETYLPVTGPSKWRVNDQAWSSREPGDIIHHPPWIPHATLAADRPLVVLYVWRGDLETDAVFLPDPMASEAPVAALVSGSR